MKIIEIIRNLEVITKIQHSIFKMFQLSCFSLFKGMIKMMLEYLSSSARDCYNFLCFLRS